MILMKMTYLVCRRILGVKYWARLSDRERAEIKLFIQRSNIDLDISEVKYRLYSIQVFIGLN